MLVCHTWVGDHSLANIMYASTAPTH